MTVSKRAMEIIKGQAAIIKLVDSIKVRGARLDTDLHLAAVSCAAHWAEHGDYTVASRLLKAMPKSTRRNALVAWFMHFTSLVKNPDKATQGDHILVSIKGDAKRWDEAEAIETPFWEFKAKEGVSVFSFDSYITSMTKGIDRALAEPTISDEQRAKLEATKAVLVAAPAVINSAVTE